MCKTTVAVPLFRSKRFVNSIISNIESMPKDDIEILISDRHCQDNAIDILADRFVGDPRIRFIKARDEISWVGNINVLLKEARGEYWRLLPHDDLSPKGSLESLIDALDHHKDAVLAYGPTHAIDIDGLDIPEKNRLNPHPVEAKKGWTYGLALQMFWKNFFEGAFKGIVRRNLVLEKEVFIRSTVNQIFPERCWLFALCFLGKFHFVPEAIYVKRFHNESAHAPWKQTSEVVFSTAQVMIEYLDQLIGPSRELSYGTSDILLNAQRLAIHFDQKQSKRPLYLPAPDDSGRFIRDIVLCQD